MQQRGRLFFWLLLAIGSAAGGYVWWDHARTSAEDSLGDNLGADTADVPPVTPTPMTARLNLELKPGDVFPLVKKITEKITQKSASGSIQSERVVELTLAIRVQAVEKDRKRLRVDYQRVRFHKDVAGEKFAFDSDDPPRSLPA